MTEKTAMIGQHDDRTPPSADAHRRWRLGGGARRLRRRGRPTRSRSRPLGAPARHGRGARRLSLLGRPRSSAISATSRRRWSRTLGRNRHRQARRPEPGRHGLSLARRVLARPGAGHAARLGLPDGRRRRVRLRLPQGREARRHQGPRRQDHRARLGRLAVDLRPDAEGGGRRHHQGEVCRCAAGRPGARR